MKINLEMLYPFSLNKRLMIIYPNFRMMAVRKCRLIPSLLASMHTIYLITNKVNGKIYVGKTSRTVEGRWKQHIEFAARGKSIYFSNAIRKYGPQAFTRKVAGQTETEEWSRYLERVWILLLNTTNSAVGYNSTFGGEGFSTGNLNPNRLNPKRGSDNSAYGKPKSEEQKLKISNSLKGKLVGEKNPFFGKQHSEETLRLLRESQLGLKRGAPSDETKEKIRQRMLGRQFSPETLEKMRQAKLGKKQSPEHIAKAAAARLGRPRGPYKNRIAA